MGLGMALTAGLRGQVTTVRDARGAVALFLFRKVAAAPACEPVFMAGPPMDVSEAAMSVRSLASLIAFLRLPYRSWGHIIPYIK